MQRNRPFISALAAVMLRVMQSLARTQASRSHFRGGRSSTKRNYGTSSSRYTPHQGKQEMARRVHQLEGRG